MKTTIKLLIVLVTTIFIFTGCDKNEEVQQNFGLPEFGLALRNAFTNAANGYQGITGPIMLNTNGDRANGTFDYYGVQFFNNAYQWYFVGQSQRVRK